MSTQSSPTRMFISPVVGSMIPAMIRERVVFPAPLFPMIPKISFSATSKVTPFTAFTTPRSMEM